MQVRVQDELLHLQNCGSLILSASCIFGRILASLRHRTQERRQPRFCLEMERCYQRCRLDVFPASLYLLALTLDQVSLS